MVRTAIWAALSFVGVTCAQDGQQGSRPGWPCVPGRAVDPSYIEVSESTGGQLFLFQKNEAAQSSVVMSASFTHPHTVLRAIGNLSGTRDFEFPVDGGMQSILVLASLECRNAILVTRPGGGELTAANSAQSIELQAGRIHRIDGPEPGIWNVRLTGTGLFVLSVLTKADISFGGVVFSAVTGEGGRLQDPLLGVRQRLEAHLGGQVANVRFQMVDAGGAVVADLDATDAANGIYRTEITPRAERFRIRATGTSASGWPFQRIEPVLFHARPPK
jgi:hypothetical protein